MADDDDNATEDHKPHRPKLTASSSPNSRCVSVPQVTGGDDDNSPSTTEDQRPRPKLTASNSGADIMLGLETDEGQSAEVEIDAADQEELMPEGQCRPMWSGAGGGGWREEQVSEVGGEE